MDPSQNKLLLLGFAMAIATVFMLSFLIFFVLVGAQWLRALLHGTPVPLVRIVAMRLRGHPPALLINAYITLAHSNVPTTIDAVESTYIEAKHRIMTSQDLIDIMKTRAAET